MDRKRLKENPINDDDFYTRQCKHCNALLSFPWKVGRKIMYRPTDGPGAYDAVRAQRHLEKWCNQLGISSIKQRTNYEKRGINIVKKKLPQNLRNVKKWLH